MTKVIAEKELKERLGIINTQLHPELYNLDKHYKAEAYLKEILNSHKELEATVVACMSALDGMIPDLENAKAALKTAQIEAEDLARRNGDLRADSMKWQGDSEALEKIVEPWRDLCDLDYIRNWADKLDSTTLHRSRLGKMLDAVCDRLERERQ